MLLHISRLHCFKVISNLTSNTKAKLTFFYYTLLDTKLTYRDLSGQIAECILQPIYHSIKYKMMARRRGKMWLYFTRRIFHQKQK